MKQQRGQVLLLCLILTAIGAAALYFVFDSGRTVSARMRTVSAADTAAFSAASWRARVLNYNAYANRAIVAQEVAIAQAITLESWAYYFENFTDTMKNFSRVYPPAYSYARAVHELAEYSRQATEAAATAEIIARDARGYGYKTLLAQSQRVMHYTASDFGLSAIAQEVAGTGDKRIKAYVLPVATRHHRFVRQYQSDPDRQRLRQIVEASLDRFTAGSRDANFALPLPGGCMPLGGSLKDSLWQYKKRGGTRLAPGLDRWEAADTASIHVPVRKRFSRRCRSLEMYPMGWGASELSAGRARDEIIANPGGVNLNGIALEDAEDQMSDSQRRNHRGTGIARVFELNYEGLRNRRFPTSRVVVLAKLKRQDIRFARSLATDGTALTGEPVMPDGKMRAIGVAEVYFRRPPDTGRDGELASLYNPYWQVRLAAPTAREKQVAAHAP